MAGFVRVATEGSEVTDEAALLEWLGIPVAVVEGEADNLKVTTAADLVRADALLSRRFGPPRVGQGHDSHPFGPHDGLALGGIRIDEAPALSGHSDGDAALHAIADALLAATGGGDLGRRFPAGDQATRGIDSRTLLVVVVADLAEAGWQAIGIDLLIRGARPRLGPARLEAMRDAIAGLVGVPSSAVAVHASTGNLDGPEGAGRSISATAFVQVVRR
jgi:2-C-methyl-D-erythritol 4-phosphate cytidylyltransferase/2-C-methyl-D-erythritol 2,4-cyclodiphosphate synthase